MPVTRQDRPGRARATWARVSRASSVTAVAEGDGLVGCWSCTLVIRSRADSSVGRTPWASATTKPLMTRVAVTRAAPPSACVRRRAVPARRMIVARGQRWSEQCSASRRSVGRISAAAISRWSTNCTRASSRRRSASSWGSPSSRARSCGVADERSARTSDLRDTGDRVWRASRVARSSGSSRRSRWKIRAVCRRCAWVRTWGRSHDSGSSSRFSFGQRCQAAMNESRTAPREAGRSPVSAKAWTRSRSRASA